MNLPSSSVCTFRCWLLMVGWVTFFGARLAVAQAPKSEGSDRLPSNYQYPLLIRAAPVRAFGPVEKDGNPKISFRNRRKDGDLTGIEHKLQSIVLPHVEFRDTPIPDAVEFLRQESRRLDADPDPDSRGVNIFLRTTAPLSRLDNSGALTNVWLPLFLRSPSTAALPPPASDRPARITLTMTRLPLLEAIRYVALKAGLTVRIERYAVSIVPPDQPSAPILQTP